MEPLLSLMALALLRLGLALTEAKVTLIAIAEVLTSASGRGLLDFLSSLRLSELMLTGVSILAGYCLFAWPSLIEGSRFLAALIRACEHSFARLIGCLFVTEHVGQVFTTGVGQWSSLSRDDSTAELVPRVHRPKGRQSILLFQTHL